MPMQLARMEPAHWNGELIAGLAPQGTWLGKAQMVGVRRRSAADQAGLRGHESAMLLVTQADGLGRNGAADNGWSAGMTTANDLAVRTQSFGSSRRRIHRRKRGRFRSAPSKSKGVPRK